MAQPEVGAPRRAIPGWILAGWLLLPLVAALQRWAPQAWVEASYGRSLYPLIASLLSSANRWTPLSLAETAVWTLLVAGALFGVRASARAIRRRAIGGRAVLRAMGRAVAVLGWALLAFSILWGLNYRRPPLAQRLGIPTGGTAADLAATAEWLARETAGAAPAGSGPTRLPYGRDALMARVEDAYVRAQSAGALDFRSRGRLGPAKLVCASGVLSTLGLSGIYIPFTGEPNVNRFLPDTDLVFAVAHEKAHQRGIAPENEANFVAFLVLLGAGDPYLRYCGAHDAAGYVLGALLRVDRDAAGGAVRLLAGRPMADWERSRRFWARYRGPAERVSRRVNDLYLRANRVPGGIRSYGAVTDLIVGYHRRRAGRGGQALQAAPGGD